DLRHAGEDGRYPARGRRRPRLPAMEGVLAGDAADREQRGDRGHAALLHPDHRRVRHSRSARWLRDPDDRADAVDRVLRQQGLAGGLRHRGCAAVSPGGADRVLPEHADARDRARPLMRKGPSWFNLTSIALGLAFLYLPIVILVIYPFNASRLV